MSYQPSEGSLSIIRRQLPKLLEEKGIIPGYIDQLTILDPITKPEALNWGDWQQSLKLVALVNQGFHCPSCGKFLFTGELHHALLTRRDAQGMNDNWLIHHSFNVLLLHEGDCHTYATRENCAVWLIKIYGNEVKEWYNDFPRKSRKRNIFDNT